jgi:hypothetical protein
LPLHATLNQDIVSYFYKIAPTITAVNNDASVPAIKAKTPSFDKSPVLFGAKDPIPPICIPIDRKLANPHKI